MKILMMTNTYLPHVGGVANSVDQFTRQIRSQGYQVTVVAPTFPDQPEEETDVIRIPAIQNFNGSDFSVTLPLPELITGRMEDLRPDIIHSHHPFLVGGMALRLADQYHIPLVFTHHTRYEEYTHYVPGDSPAMKEFSIHLSTGYGNAADQVVAPSESIRELIRERGVTSPIAVIPTGVDIEKFRNADGRPFRQKQDIPENSLVLGLVSRLAPEKNIEFLCKSILPFLKENKDALFLAVGDGPSGQTIDDFFKSHDIQNQLKRPGSLEGEELYNAYKAMNLFVFTSKSETQGLVLAEAMAAGLPVVALDASGTREVVKDKQNGRLVSRESEEQFSQAVSEVVQRIEQEDESLAKEVNKTAEQFSMQTSGRKMEQLYENLLDRQPKRQPLPSSNWDNARKRLEAEWKVWKNLAQAAGNTFRTQFQEDQKKPE
jgi:1,2-diacylglycerol 3-alpha-glucosyltransferase